MYEIATIKIYLNKLHFILTTKFAGKILLKKFTTEIVPAILIRSFYSPLSHRARYQQWFGLCK